MLLSVFNGAAFKNYFLECMYFAVETGIDFQDLNEEFHSEHVNNPVLYRDFTSIISFHKHAGGGTENPCFQGTCLAAQQHKIFALFTPEIVTTKRMGCY